MKNAVIQVLLLVLLLVGCSGDSEISPNPQPANNDPDTPPPANSQNIATPESIQETLETQTEEEIQTEIDDCYANADHPIGLQIAADFEDLISYAEVMNWFCSGFEFEDILTALETAEISEFPPEILLTMLEYGQTWEEIWAEIGLD